MKKVITILGSTGSVGSKAVDIVSEHLDECEVFAITANTNVDLLIHQAKLLKPRLVVIGEKSLYKKLKYDLDHTGIRVESGEDAIVRAVSNTDLVISSIVGIAGLKSTFASIRNGSMVAIANKESIVCGGSLISSTEMERIIPMDSEHNAIYRIIDKDTDRIIITASGGPFHNNNKEFTVSEALNHPTWNMGKKISIDSATMMNKVLEVIEAHYLFGLCKENIDILIHPECIIHGMVIDKDGSHKALLSNPDMKSCITYALSVLLNKKIKSSQCIDFAKIAKFTFFNPDYDKFPSLRFLKSDQHITISVANELAVTAFLESKIPFQDIYKVVAETLEKFHYSCVKSVEEIIELSNIIKSITYKIINN